MTTADTLTLHLGVAQLDSLCHHLASHAPGSEQHLAALTALQTLIAASADAGEQARPLYQEVRHTLERHIEQVREGLLQQRAQHLAQALRQRDVAAIAALYRPLSRSGFWEALGRAAPQLDAATLAALAPWARHWVDTARQRGEQASGFPDALDFHQAGIDVVEYTAMNDVLRFAASLPS